MGCQRHGPDDAYLEFFVVVGESVFEYDIPCFFRGEGKKYKKFVYLGFGEAHVLMLLPGIITLPDEGFKYVEGLLMSECFSLNVETEISSLRDKFKSFPYFAYYYIVVFHLYGECAVPTKECESVSLWVLEVYLDESRPILGNGIESDINRFLISHI